MSNPLTDLKALAERIDFKRIAAIAKRVDLAKLAGALAELEPEDLVHLRVAGARQAPEDAVARSARGLLRVRRAAPAGGARDQAPGARLHAPRDRPDRQRLLAPR